MEHNRCDARPCLGPKVCQQVGDQMAELRLESELPCVWNDLSLDDFLKNAETR